MEEVCTESEDAICKAVECCFYLDRALLSANLLNLFDKNKVSLTKLQSIQLKPKVSKNQVNDMSLTLKRSIVHREKFRWKNEYDFLTAKEFHLDLKIDEEIFYFRCMQIRVILYDTKYEMDERVKILRSNQNLLF